MIRNVTKTPVILKRKYFILYLQTIIIISLLFTTMVILNNNFITKKHEKNYQYIPIVVQTGDTLWSIATKSKLSLDTRVVIEHIREYNSISSNSLIKPGQIIYIPFLEE